MAKPLICEECKFYESINGARGRCKKHAPFPIGYGTAGVKDAIVAWPIVERKDHACAESRPK